MKAIILAGGKGRRLAPYTTVLPKPLMPIGEMPILEVILRQLKNHNCEEVILAVGHLSELLMAFFNDGRKFGLKINYSVEEKPLGTAGALRLIRNLDEPFIVMNGDVLTDLNYSDLYKFHQTQKGVATIATYERSVKIDFGVMETDKDDLVDKYIEKPIINYKVSMGVYIFNPEVMDFIKPDTYFDFPDLVKLLINEGKKVVSFLFKGYWLDIGRPDDYEKAINEFELRKNIFLPR
jgi:NDP-sugar pyrophosphorylase family protein